MRGAGIDATVLTVDDLPVDFDSSRTVISGVMSRLADLTLRLGSAVTAEDSFVLGADVTDTLVERIEVDAPGARFGPGAGDGMGRALVVRSGTLRDVHVALDPALDTEGVRLGRLGGGGPDPNGGLDLENVTVTAGRFALHHIPDLSPTPVTATARRVHLRSAMPLAVRRGFLELSDAVLDAAPAPPGPVESSTAASVLNTQAPPVGLTLDRVTLVGDGDPGSVAMSIGSGQSGTPAFLRARHIAVAGFGHSVLHQRNGGDMTTTIDHSNLDTSPGAILEMGSGAGRVIDNLGPGDRSGDPGLVAPTLGDFQLRAGSPAIDIGGEDLLPGAPADLGGGRRPVDGDGDGTVLADAGAFEHQFEVVLDRDGDGVNRPFDCDDANPAIRPGAIDAPENGIDEDCDGADAANLDRDRDGFNRPQDCDDANPAIRPGAREVPGNDVDENCDRVTAPFPTLQARVAHAFARSRTTTRLTQLSVVQVPAGATIAVTCAQRKDPGRSRRRRSCAFARHTRRTQQATREIKLVGLFKRRRLAPGTVIRVQVTAPETIGKQAQLTMRRGKAPARKDTCVPPGRAPTAC